VAISLESFIGFVLPIAEDLAIEDWTFLHARKF